MQKKTKIVIIFTEIRQRFTEQLRSLEQRTDVQVVVLGELYEFYKRRADVEADNARALDKLAKQIAGRNKQK